MVENNPDPREQELVDMSLKYRFENGMMSEEEIKEYLEKEGQSSSWEHDRRRPAAGDSLAGRVE